MKRLMLLLIWVLLPISVDAGVKFEMYNASDLSWGDVDTCWDLGVGIMDSANVTYADLSYGSGSILVGSAFTERPKKHDTLKEYIVGLDTVFVLHRIECDST